MKKNLFGIILGAVVVAIIAAAAGLQFWFERPGIREFNGGIHVELNEIGYIIDAKTGEITGQSPVSLNGSTATFDPETFEGEALVLGYQNTEGGKIETTLAVEKTGDGFYLIHQLEECTHSEEINGVTQNVSHLCDYYYTYYIYPQKPDFLIALVESYEEDAVYVVCADSEEDALAQYQWFLKNRPLPKN